MIHVAIEVWQPNWDPRRHRFTDDVPPTLTTFVVWCRLSSRTL